MTKQANQKKQALELPEVVPDPDAVRGGMSDLSIGQILDAKAAPHAFEHICLDYSLVTRRDDARGQVRRLQLEAAKRLDPETGEIPAAFTDPINDAEEVLAEAQAAMDAQTVTFEFQSIGRRQVEALMKVYPPTKAQLDEYSDAVKKLGAPRGNGLQYDSDKFPIAIIAASSVKPQMSYREAERLWDSDTFTRAELARLFSAAWGVNNIIAS